MYLLFDERTIREAARSRLPDNNIMRIALRQFIGEWGLRWFKQLTFRTNQNDRAVEAYQKMSLDEFDAINARQRWANWRTLPRNLSGRITDHPLFALDLCCGVGQSTEVLAFYLPSGSRILGLEFQADFVAKAGQRRYLDAQGHAADVTFRNQSVLEPFCDTQGQVISDGSVNLINCVGAIGSHFDPQATERLMREIARVTKAGSLILLDSGTKGTDLQTLIAIAKRYEMHFQSLSRSTFLDIYPQVCFLRG